MTAATSDQAERPAQREQLEDREGRTAFRVRIGVTGHRRLPDELDLVPAVVDQLERVRRLFPPSEVTPVVFTLMSALAEGADRIVAREAFEVFSDAEFELEAVLPLSIDDYITDFETQASRREFQDLLAQASGQIVVGSRSRVSQEDREKAYERAGYYVVDRSDVLIAVWDGQEARGPGGTADIVEYSRRSDVDVPLLIVPTTPDVKNGETARKARYPWSARSFKDSMEAFHRVDEWNRMSIHERPLEPLLTSTMERLESQLEASDIRWQFKSAARWALPRLVRADSLALRYQSQYRTLTRVIHFLAAFAVTAVAAQTMFAPHQSGWLGFEIGVLVLLLAALWVGRRGRVHQRWVGYRSLAEAFRSGLFLTLSATHERREDESRKQIGEPNEPWFQRAFSEAWRQRPSVPLQPRHAAELQDFLVDGWIDNQITYHRAKQASCRRERNAFTWTIGAFAVATIIIAVLHIVGWPSDSWEPGLGFLAIALPGFGAALTGLREHGQLRLHEERSKRTADRLERLKLEHGQAPTLASVRRLANETQRVIVEENLDWSGVVEFQDLEMVI